MPIVTIQITREGTTPEQKAALIKGATDHMGGRAQQAAGVDVRGYPGSGGDKPCPAYRPC
jgi:hypothetical protein